MPRSPRSQDIHKTSPAILLKVIPNDPRIPFATAKCGTNLQACRVPVLQFDLREFQASLRLLNCWIYQHTLYRCKVRQRAANHLWTVIVKPEKRSFSTQCQCEPHLAAIVSSSCCHQLGLSRFRPCPLSLRHPRFSQRMEVFGKSSTSYSQNTFTLLSSRMLGQYSPK